jgi:hypothetical protein
MVVLSALIVINIRWGSELRTIKDMGTTKCVSALLFLLVSYSLLGREYGPPVGGKMAGFELPDQDGKLHNLRDLLGPQGAILWFYRSADW